MTSSGIKPVTFQVVSQDYIKWNYLSIFINANDSKFNVQILCEVMWYASCWIKTVNCPLFEYELLDVTICLSFTVQFEEHFFSF